MRARVITSSRISIPVQNLFLKASARELSKKKKKFNEEHERFILDLKVFGDGSWKKRGFKSLYGVVMFIGYYSGKVIDLIIKNSYCHACTSWKNMVNTSKYQE